MKCPLCIDSDLRPEFRGGIEIDVCPGCRGIWLDRGELDKLTDEPPARPAVVGPAPVGSVPPPTPTPAWPSDQDHRSGPDRDRDRERWSQDHDRPRSKKGKKKKPKSRAARLADLLDDVLDL